MWINPTKLICSLKYYCIESFKKKKIFAIQHLEIVKHDCSWCFLAHKRSLWAKGDGDCYEPMIHHYITYRETLGFMGSERRLPILVVNFCTHWITRRPKTWICNHHFLVKPPWSTQIRGTEKPYVDPGLLILKTHFK